MKRKRKTSRKTKREILMYMGDRKPSSLSKHKTQKEGLYGVAPNIRIIGS